MNLKEARQFINDELKTLYEKDEAINIAELVLEHITSLQRTEQVRNQETELHQQQIELLHKMIGRLSKNEPVQYVTGEAWFAGMKFKVDKNVLIPRPETEELVDWIVREINTQYSMFNAQCSILDIGTGSGCIPIAIKKKIPKAIVSAIDVCSEAIYISVENAATHDTEINFILLDFLDESKWETLGQFDIIVSNPPYIVQSESKTMHQRVTGFEPGLALFVPDNDALLFYRKIADFAAIHLHDGGSLFVEINESLGKEVVGLFIEKGFKNIELRKDMQGKDRMVRGVLSRES